MGVWLGEDQGTNTIKTHRQILLTATHNNGHNWEDVYIASTNQQTYTFDIHDQIRIGPTSQS